MKNDPKPKNKWRTERTQARQKQKKREPENEQERLAKAVLLDAEGQTGTLKAKCISGMYMQEP